MAAQTVYGTNNAPGGGNAFFAGLEELFSSPGSFVKDAVPGGDSGYVPPKNAAGGAEPGGGSAFLAGVEEIVQAPSQAGSDFSSSIGSVLPSTTTTVIVLGLVAVIGLSVAYSFHKVL